MGARKEPNRNRVVVPARQATYFGAIHSLESILGLLKCLKQRALTCDRKWLGRSLDFSLNFYILSLCLNFLPSNTTFLFVKLPFTASTCISELVIYGPRSKHRGCVLRILTMHYCLLGKILPYLGYIQTHALSGLSFLRMLCFTWSQVVH
jgi:hypothetical protein